MMRLAAPAALLDHSNGWCPVPSQSGRPYSQAQANTPTAPSPQRHWPICRRSAAGSHALWTLAQVLTFGLHCRPRAEPALLCLAFACLAARQPLLLSSAPAVLVLTHHLLPCIRCDQIAHPAQSQGVGEFSRSNHETRCLQRLIDDCAIQNAT